MADQVVEAKYVTEEELLALGSDARVEVVNGEIVEMSPSGEEEHHDIAGNIHDLLKQFVKQHRLGRVYMDGLIYILSESEQGLKGARVPDVSFIRKGTLAKDRDRRKPIHAAPTLAVEVMSPDDDPDDMLIKVREYLAAGTEQVWVVYPRPKEVHQYKRNEATVTTYRLDDTLTADDLFPGLKIALSVVFAVDEETE